LIEILFLSIFLLFFGSTAIAGQKQGTYTWVTEQAYLTAQFTPATRCMTATGNNTLTIAVQRQGNQMHSGATVHATVTKPNETTATINFTDEDDGNYTNTYNFDANGTWKFSVTATHAGYTDGTVESYVYVGDFNLLVSFVNNNQNIYDRYTGSVRNLVTNIDGNYFTGIDGNVTIYYPSSSAWVSNAAMTESSDGNGEYYYNFTAPTTLGEYSATSTFACGGNSDSNSAGRFTVVTSCGNGTCNTWEDCSSCSADCGSCPTTPTTLPGGGSGGGGGGGGAPPEAPPSGPKILSWQFDETPKIGNQSSITIKISNPARGRNFLLSTEISQAKEIGYSETQQVLGVRANETRSVILEEKYAPKIAGTQTIEIKLLSDDRQTVHDDLVGTFDIAGIVRYDVSIECLDAVARIGSKANASITLLNLGDYYKDVELRWWIEDSDGKQIGLASLPIALYANETRSIVRSVNIPAGSKKGQYSFKTVVDYKGQKTEAFCNFTTEESVEYYRKVIESLETRLNELNNSVQSKKEQGHDVAEIEKKISETKTIISSGKAKIESGDFSELDGILAKVDAAIEEITLAEKALQTRAYLALPQALIALALILLIIVALILYLLKGLADELLGLKEPKKEAGKEKEVKQLDALLGLQEHKKEKMKKGKTKKKKKRKAKRKPKKEEVI